MVLQGNVIISRWKKKSRDKREKTLLTVDPDMYPQQQLLRHMMIHGHRGSLTWTKLRDRHNSYLLPYINIPNLRDDPSKFLSLLLNRARFPPEQWAPFDNTELGLGWYNESFNIDFCFGSIIMHGSRYGQFTEWTKSSDELWTTIGFPRGKLILQAQECVMSFLQKMVEQLLEGIDDNSNIGSDKWNEPISSSGYKSRDHLVSERV